MQYVGRAIGSVSKTWSSINPAYLSGAIDIIVVEQPDGKLSCSPFHVRFGKFQILKPSQKKVQVLVNGKTTNIPMKLADNGEAYFVFETDSDLQNIPDELLASPVLSAASSPGFSGGNSDLEEPPYLNINEEGDDRSTMKLSKSVRESTPSQSRTKEFQEKINKKLTDIKIPSKPVDNGDLLLDIEGYKPNNDMIHDTDMQLKLLLKEELGGELDISKFIREDSNGGVRIINPYESGAASFSPYGTSPTNVSESNLAYHANHENEDLESISSGSPMSSPGIPADSPLSEEAGSQTNAGLEQVKEEKRHYIKTIRLTSEQLKCLDLRYGQNDLEFSIDHGKAIVTAKLYVWRWDVPVVISDIDGTITKSDALGHVLAMIGKDWTHVGVAKLFSEIAKNGYNIMYLTARSAGQADSTRSYLRSIQQNGEKLPLGPVILSPDRTMAALRREVILKKPEVFKIACLNDIRSLYFEDDGSNPPIDSSHQQGDSHLRLVNSMDTRSDVNLDDRPTPFFAGFGNRITDALSYRTVGVPSSRIFTINTEGEVHMELLELAGYKSSYIHINELVDHFFPPVKPLDDEIRSVKSLEVGSPVNASIENFENSSTAYDTGLGNESRSFFRANEKFTDANFWRDPIPDIDDLSDISSVADEKQTVGIPGSGPKRSKSAETDKLPLTSEQQTYNDTRSPPSSRKVSSSDYRSFSREELGKQIYLELGSPSSPRNSFIIPDELNLDNLQHLTIARPSVPTSGVSKVNVLDDIHTGVQEPTGGKSVSPERGEELGPDKYDSKGNEFNGDDDEEEDEDDEFDEDEFDEDEFAD